MDARLWYTRLPWVTSSSLSCLGWWGRCLVPVYSPKIFWGYVGLVPSDVRRGRATIFRAAFRARTPHLHGDTRLPSRLLSRDGSPRHSHGWPVLVGARSSLFLIYPGRSLLYRYLLDGFQGGGLLEGIPPLANITVDFLAVQCSVSAFPREDHVVHVEGIPPLDWHMMPCKREKLKR